MKKIYLQGFQCCSVSKVVETDHDGMMLTLEVQTKIPVATETWRSWCERGSLLSSWQQAWPSTRVLSQQLLSSVRPPPRATSSSTASWMPVCLVGVGQTSPSHRAKGAMELLPAGPALHGRAPLSKQTVQWATSHGQHGTCHYQPCMAGSLPKTQARPRAWTCTALDSNFRARVCHQRIPFQNY